MRIYLIFWCCWILAGCAHAVPTTAQQTLLIPQTIDADIIDPDSFRKGGTIVLVPFTPGELAPASSQVDKVSLMIIKGLTEALVSTQQTWTVLPASDADRAEYVLEGFVERYSEPGKIKRRILRDNNVRAGVSGFIRERETNRKILTFRHERSARHPGDISRQLGYAIGQDVGAYLAEQSGKE